MALCEQKRAANAPTLSFRDGVDGEHLVKAAARELAAAADEGGFGFIDAPVSGGQAGAENGVLTIMCGGDAAVFERAAPVMDAYARSRRLLGDVGAGQLAGRPEMDPDEFTLSAAQKWINLPCQRHKNGLTLINLWHCTLCMALVSLKLASKAPSTDVIK